MDQELFVARMKEARERKKMTLKELADACGVSISAMNRYAAYAAQPGVEVVWQMAKVLGVSMDWLCGQEENPQPPTLGLIIRVLSLLLSTQMNAPDNQKHVWIEGEYSQEDWDMAYGFPQTPAHFEKDEQGRTRIVIDQWDVLHAISFEDWQQVLNMTKKGVLPKDVYTSWIEGNIQKNNSIQLPVPMDELPCSAADIV